MTKREKDRQTIHGDLFRRRLDLRGQVQGVGFRPFVYRLALEHTLVGHVANNSNGAVIEVEGPAERIEAFEADLVGQLPPLAHIAELRRTQLTPVGEVAFQIHTSQADEQTRPEVTPDAATCEDCRRELFDPSDRRFRYPFINCTNCGPRYSIIRTVPYDRPATTMAVFKMCPPCQSEYDSPADRRFHAQPNACADCGPQLQLCSDPNVQLEGDPIRTAARMLTEVKILAIKGIGGYHLACRADREDVVRRMRERKLRDGKPLALMVPSEAVARQICRLNEAELLALRSPAAPIVLAQKNERHGLAASIAPECDTFGIILPYAPVHHLLFAEGLGPLVMTSANLSGQPLTYRDEDAFRELSDVADAFLIHNREIFRPIDDSVVFTFRDETVPIRRARGYAPRPIRLKELDQGDVGGKRILAVGGELKSTVCLLTGGEAILSEHLGDLSNPEAYRHFIQAIERMDELFGFSPDVVVHDLHPQYLSTHYAQKLGLPTIAVQHHHAHIAGVMAEWNEPGPVVGLSCDGTGYGTDGATWGGEVLYCQRGEFERLGHLEYFPLVGGDAAALETWRPAAALLRQAFAEHWLDYMPTNVAAGLRTGRDDRLETGPTENVAAGPRTGRDDRLETGPTENVAAGLRTGRGKPNDYITLADLSIFDQQLQANLNTPMTSSLGRVFDAVSYLLGLCSRNRHEAEAAMTLEAAAANETADPYPYEISRHEDQLALSLLPTVTAIVEAQRAGESVARLAAGFHETVACLLADAASLACEQRRMQTVALSGGCFANRRLLTRLVELLEARHLRVLYHRCVPSGDGGLSLGQAYIAAWNL